MMRQKLPIWVFLAFCVGRGELFAPVARKSALRGLRALEEEDFLAESVAKVEKKVLTFVTSNEMKLREVQMILGEDFPAEMRRVDIDLYELQGDPEIISREKCRLAAEKVDGPVFVEDTSLFLDDLNGLPGPYIKWFLDALGNEGIFRLMKAEGKHAATAQCCLAFSRGRGFEPVVFKGVCKGRLVDPKGAGGFGWDALFAAEGYDVTFAQMSREEKNKLSHRSQALRMFREYLEENPL
eukprot:scaffold1060_cov246-Pinguiococcus_pyrenoidosus.AAC.5